MGEFGFFVLGVGMGAALVLSVWQWIAGREQNKVPADVYTDYHKEYYTPVVQKETVEDAVVTHVTKARSKRIKARKKPTTKTRRQK